MRIAIVTSHPVQYHAPLFRALAKACELVVLYAHRQTAQQQADAGFGVAFDWDADLFAGYRHEFLENEAARPGVDRFDGCDCPGIDAAFERLRPDFVVVTGWSLKAYWQARRAARRRGIPVVTRGDSELRTPRSAWRRAAKALAWPTLLARFDGHLYPGARTREYLRHYGVPEDRLFRCPHCVDTNWFDDRAGAARSEARQRLAALGGMPGVPAVLFAGKFIETKRIADLVAATHGLHRAGVPIQAILVGSGPLEGELRRQAGEGPGRIAFAGFRNQSELPALYAIADAVCLPSQGETWGLVVNEAMACGVPAVVSEAVGCAPDMVEPGVTGEVFPAADRAALAGALRKVIDRGRTPAVVAALRATSARFSAEASAQAILACADRLHRAVA